MQARLPPLARLFLGAVRDLTPLVLVIVVFEVGVLHQPLSVLAGLAGGLVLVVVGLTLFIQGLEYGLFPLGEAMADALAHKGSLPWLVVFAFAMGFGTTVAEPALIAVTAEAAEAACEAGLVEPDLQSRRGYADGLRYTVAVSVGVALVLGVIRIVKGWPIQYFIISGYLLVVLITPLAPDEIVGIAYDAGGVTTSTVTVPLVTALGVGLASAIRGRNPLTDGFGLIAFASLTPIVFVLAYGAWS